MALTFLDDVALPRDPQTVLQAAPKQYVDAKAVAGGTMTGAINMNGNYLYNLSAPGNPTDAATKGYVDDRTPKVTVATTAPSSPAVNDLWVDLNG